MANMNNNSIIPEKRKSEGLSVYLTKDAVKNQINSILGSKNGLRFTSALISAVEVNTGLKECKNTTIVSAALLGESLNLSPSPQLGQYYMVPFNDKERGKVAQFILGYKGMIQLAVRSGQYKKLNVLAIKEGELISYDPLNEEIKVNLIQDEEQRENAPTIGYYAMFEYVNGFKKSLYWSKAKMEKHAERYSNGYKAKKGYTFWEKDFDAMAYKTMLRQLISKWGIMSIEMQTAYLADGATISEDLRPVYVDNTESEFMETEPAPAPEAPADPITVTAKEIRDEAKAAAESDDIF